MMSLRKMLCQVVVMGMVCAKSAMACPDLSGQHVCQLTGDPDARPYELLIQASLSSPEANEGVYRYTETKESGEVRSGTVVAPYTLTRGSETFRNFCSEEGSILYRELNGVIMGQDVKITVAYRLNADRNMEIQVDAVSATQSVHGLHRCQRVEN